MIRRTDEDDPVCPTKYRFPEGRRVFCYKCILISIRVETEREITYEFINKF